jgi:hypothetical protein
MTKKRRAPEPPALSHLISVRMSPDQLGALDAWIARQYERSDWKRLGIHPMSRPEAIRRLVDKALI